VVQFITCGRHNDYNYMVMELLGENISELRRKQPGGKFSMLTTCKLGMQMLRAIEAVHELGYLHRDIKPVRPSSPLAAAGLSWSCYYYYYSILCASHAPPHTHTTPSPTTPSG
jgi:serine/threonine protein kinase